MTPKIAFQPSDFLAFGAAGAGLGVGARGLRHMWDVYQGTDQGAPPLPKSVAPSVKVPVDVSEDEAKELEGQGIHVRKAAGFFDNIALTAGIGMPAAYGGWKLLDDHFDGVKRQAVQGRLQKARSRVQKLLEGSPTATDASIGGTMKAAEDAYFSKSANSMIASGLSSIMSGLTNVVSPLAIPLTIGGGLVAASAFNDSRNANRYRSAMKQIRRYGEHQNAQTPQAELEPVLREKKKDQQALPKIAELGTRLKAKLNGGSPR